MEEVAATTFSAEDVTGGVKTETKFNTEIKR